MAKKLPFILAFCLISCTFFSQKMKITGNVQDTTNGQIRPLKNALAMVIRIKDSVLLDFKRTDSNGDFFFNLAYDTVQLIVSHPKLNENTYYIFGHKDNHEFDIKKIILPPKSQNIKEVVIFAYKDPVYYKGDTLVYIADSFKTQPNAVVEDLLKKLPGIQVATDGSIKVQGKDIQQVLVDGDEFFGSDPTMATRNLGATGIQTVEVYEKKDVNSTDDSETIQVLDLRLKDSAKKGYFGKVSGASDFALTNGKTPYYEGEILANKFNKTQKISFFTLGSNTMKSSLEWRDMYKYGMASNNNGWDEENDEWNWNFSNSGGTGIPRTLKTGVYYNENLSKKTKLGFNYTYGNNQLNKQERNRSQYFLSDTSYVSDLLSTSENKSESHEFNLKLTQNLDSLTVLEIEPRITLNKTSTSTLDNTDFYTEDDQLSRNTTVDNSSEATGTNIKTRVGIRRDFKKKNRKLITNYYFNLDDNSSTGLLNINNTSFLSTSLIPPTDQKKDNSLYSQSHTASIAYTEPLGKLFKIDFDYEFYNNKNNQSKLSNNRSVSGEYDSLITFVSNNFKNERNQHRVGTQLTFEKGKHKISGGLRARNVVIDNYNVFQDTTIHQDINNLLPRARYVYKISQSNRFTVRYNTNSAQPSIDQIQPVFDNTNPNRIQTGNPNLKPNYVHSFSAGYNFYKPLSGTHFWSSLNHNITENAFANSTNFDADGRMTSQTINVNGNMSSSFVCGGGFPLFKKFMEVFPSFNSSYSKSNSYVNEVKNITINKSVGGGMSVSIERDSIELRVGGNYSYIVPTSTISTQSLNPYQNQSYNADIILKLPLKISVQSDVKYMINSGRTQGYNINFLIWNASIGRAFLKNQNLIAKIEAYDLLNQNTSANRFVNSNVITDTQSAIIARYFMARVTYKFNSTKTKEADDFF